MLINTIYMLLNSWVKEWVKTMKDTKLVRKQLDKALLPLRVMAEVSVPRKGWIRAIRRAIGMSAHQLGVRLGVSQQRVAQIEKQEITGGLSIKAMRKVAEGLDCRFVYGFVPNNSLEDIITRQARKGASHRLAQASHTMDLEDQGLSKEGNEEILAEMVAELIRKLSPDLWRDK